MSHLRMFYSHVRDWPLCVSRGAEEDAEGQEVAGQVRDRLPAAGRGAFPRAGPCGARCFDATPTPRSTLLLLWSPLSPSAATARREYRHPHSPHPSPLHYYCTQQDKVLDVASFMKFLHDRIKVNGKAGNLGESVSISSDKTKVTVTAETPFSKR